jgi:quercetin dioxygenase-like cupin family protein
MRRSLVAPVLFALIVGLALLGSRAFAGAQEATPSGGAAPIVVESLGSVPAPDAPGKVLVLLRVTLAPGAIVPTHVHPGQLVVAVESGAFALTPLRGQGRVLRADAGTPTAAEEVAQGTEVTFQAGDWFVEPPDSVHSARNPGDTPTVLLISGLVAADQPILMPMEMGTPAP